MFDLSFHKTPKIIPALFSAFLWKVDTVQKEVFLTFDDGPIPQLTSEILAILKQYEVKATFFCVGDNIVKHPEIYQQILKEGHATGNHTFNHLKAWKVPYDLYVANILKAENAMNAFQTPKRKLFRPPYGQYTPKLYKALKSLGYEVVMWDILTKDYLSNLNIKNAFNSCIRQIEPGSIIVFHDNIKARNNVLNLLPMYINEILSKGYKFSTL